MSTEINISRGIPYTGATQSVDLGANNLTANNIFDGFTSVAASGTLITLTLASTPSYLITGSGGQTIKLPDATTLPKGALYNFNNNQSSGAILVNNNSNTLVKSVPSGGNMILELTDNSIAAGSWDAHFQAPSNVSWSTNTLDYVGSITGATWNGVAVADNRIASSATWNAKQDALVSGTNIKTINSSSVLGSGNLDTFTLVPTQTVTSSATVTPTTSNQLVVITAQAVALTLAAPTGTPAQGQPLMIRIKDNGTARAITWTSGTGGYRVIGVTLPTTTVANKTTYVGCIYNSTDTRWDVIGVTTEA